MTTSVQSCPCAVASTGRGLGVLAMERIRCGSVALAITGSIRAAPTRHSIQIGLDEHVECDGRLDEAQMRIRHPWRFLNHSCDPNAAIVGRTLVARRTIEPGDEITFDYTTTEARMAEPFACRCGAPACLGEIRGFLHLSAREQLARAGIVAPHLKSFLPKPGRHEAEPSHG